MILDAIIALIAGIVEAIAAVVGLAFIPLANLLIMAIEAIGGIFVAGFSLARIERKDTGTSSRASAIGGYFTLALIIGVIGWFFILPKVMNRNIALVAEDGHSLPFAAVIIHSNDGNTHKRTDKAGNVSIPRFGTTAITIKDPRYVEKTWTHTEIQAELMVDRTVLGSGLDFLSGRLLKTPAK